MSTVSFQPLKNNENSIIYNIPSGKLRMIDGEPKRVSSEPSRGSCFYVAMERISFLTESTTREPYVNKNNPYSKNLQSLLDGKNLEQFSQLLEQFEKQLNNLETGAHRSLRKVNEMLDKKLALFLLNNYHDLDTPSGKQWLQSMGLTIEILQTKYPQVELRNFVNSTYDNFYKFMHNQYFSAKLNACENFLNNICTHRIRDFLSEMEGDDLALRVSRLQLLIQALCATKYGFVTIQDEAFQNIKSLLEAVRTCGPMLISGKFGKGAYKTPPFMFTDLPEKPVFGWTPGAERTNDTRSHVVILMGVSTENGTVNNEGGHVYFLDPIDSSVTSEIYKISYKNLKTHLVKFPTMDGLAIYPSGRSDFV